MLPDAAWEPLRSFCHQPTSNDSWEESEVVGLIQFYLFMPNMNYLPDPGGKTIQASICRCKALATLWGSGLWAVLLM